MKILVWNVRGLNHPLKQREVVGRINRTNSSIVCLLETRVKHHKMERILNKSFPDWKAMHNYDEAYNGRIWLLWKEPIHVSLISVTNQSITCKINVDSKQFFFSAIYGSNDGIGRRRLWSHLQALNDTFEGEPWMIAGDFNIISHPSESSNESQEFTAEIREFTNCLSHIAAFDHVFSGLLFT